MFENMISFVSAQQQVYPSQHESIPNDFLGHSMCSAFIEE